MDEIEIKVCKPKVNESLINCPVISLVSHYLCIGRRACNMCIQLILPLYFFRAMKCVPQFARDEEV